MKQKSFPGRTLKEIPTFFNDKKYIYIYHIHIYICVCIYIYHIHIYHICVHISYTIFLSIHVSQTPRNKGKRVSSKNIYITDMKLIYIYIFFFFSPDFDNSLKQLMKGTQHTDFPTLPLHSILPIFLGFGSLASDYLDPGPVLNPDHKILVTASP